MLPGHWLQKCKLMESAAWVFIGIFCLIGLPFQVWKDIFNPAVTSKILFCAWIVVGILVLSILHFADKREITVNISMIDVLCGVYVFYLVINKCFINQNSIDKLTCLEYVVIPVFYLYFRSVNRKGQKNLFLALIAAVIGQSIYGILQLTGSFSSLHAFFSITGSFFNPGPYGGYLACVFPIMLGMFYFQQPKFCMGWSWRILCIVALAIVFVALIFSKSRAAWLGCFAGSIFILWEPYLVSVWRTIKKKQRLIRMLWIGSMACVLIFCFIMLYQMKRPSADGRLLIWRNTISMIMDRPLTGLGVGQFKAHYMNYQADYFHKTLPDTMNLPAGDVISAFNEYLEIMAEQGLIGLLFLVSIILFVYKTKVNDDVLVRNAQAGVLCILIFASFSYPFSMLPIKLTFVFFIALIASKQYSVAKVCIRKQQAKVLLCMLCIIPVYPMVKNIDQISSIYRTWENAIQTFKFKSKQGLILYDSVFPLLSQNGVYCAMYGRMLNVSGKTEQALEVLNQAKVLQPNNEVLMDLGDNYKLQKQYALAEQSYRRAWLMIPSRIRPRYLLAKLYIDMDRKEEAKLLIMETLDWWATRKHTLDTYAFQWEMENMLQKLN